MAEPRPRATCQAEAEPLRLSGVQSPRPAGWMRFYSGALPVAIPSSAARCVRPGSPAGTPPPCPTGWLDPFGLQLSEGFASLLEAALLCLSRQWQEAGRAFPG